MTKNPPQSEQTVSFQLKGSLFSLHVLHLLTTDIERLSAQLRDFVQQSPKFFQRAPLVIDVQKVNQNPLDFLTLAEKLKQLQLIPVGIRGLTSQDEKAAIDAGFAIFSPSKNNSDTSEPTPESISQPSEASKFKAPEPIPVKTMPAMLITQPVRSGQQIFAEGRDLIIQASVGAGAEVLADGNIHIYGRLLGRAMAGVCGDQSARIYCQHLDAELVSIAGKYWMHDDFDQLARNNIYLYLENQQLHLGQLNL